jgi:hypothetical protein
MTPDPDAALCALCCEFFTIANLLRAWAAEEVELTDEASQAAMAAFCEVLGAIATTRAVTARGRRAKLQAANAALRGVN